MERKLASVQKVLALEPIENADSIELAKIQGWQCVVRKGVFNVGDLGVFLEIDSVPPDTDPFRFLWQKKGETEPTPRPSSFRIRTIRLRGVLSQGLLLPREDVFIYGSPLGRLVPETKGFPSSMEGSDLTELLCVTKYEPPALPARLGGEPKGNFPSSIIPKTDEMRVQSIPGVLEEMKGEAFVATVKYDGTSATYLINPYTDEFMVCSRNLALKEGDSVYWEVARKYDIEQILRKNPGIAIQGEICGPRIQANRLGLKEMKLFVFNVYDISTGRYKTPWGGFIWCQDNGLEPAEVAMCGSHFNFDLDNLLAAAEGKYPDTQNEREGIVVRPCEDIYSNRLGGRLSFKAISNKFLMGGGD